MTRPRAPRAAARPRQPGRDRSVGAPPASGPARGDVVVFLGPSLPLRDARAHLDADYWPPARQGDVFRALESRPRAIVLIDGVFESVPSVWHHELVAAHRAGVALFGASSMGALRAAELPGLVTPLGEIARRYARGEWNDDAAVALLHGDAESGYRPLTVPWVNAWAAAQAARRAGLLSAREARELCRVAAQLFYQHRTWAALTEALPWPRAKRTALLDFVRRERVDLKADDARACLAHVATARLPERAPVPSRFSSFVRRTRLGPATAGGQGGQAGARTLLLAEFARLAGLEASPESIAHWRERLLPGPADQREAWAEALALEALVLAAPEYFVADGPSLGEGRALERARRGG